jgi:hypothetical protein
VLRDKIEAVDELETLPPVIVDADWHRYAAKPLPPDGPQPCVDRGRVRTGRTKHMATGANHRPCVGYAAVERLFIHLAILANASGEPRSISQWPAR